MQLSSAMSEEVPQFTHLPNVIDPNLLVELLEFPPIGSILRHALPFARTTKDLFACFLEVDLVVRDGFAQYPCAMHPLVVVLMEPVDPLLKDVDLLGAIGVSGLPPRLVPVRS